MTLPNRHDFIIEQGKTFKWWFRVQFRDGTTADLPSLGYDTARCYVRPVSAAGELAAPVLKLTTGNGGVVLGSPPIDDGDGQTWSGYLWAHASTTGKLDPWGIGLYDLEIEDEGGDVIAVLRGTAVLEVEATYD